MVVRIIGHWALLEGREGDREGNREKACETDDEPFNVGAFCLNVPDEPGAGRPALRRTTYYCIEDRSFASGTGDNRTEQRIKYVDFTKRRLSPNFNMPNGRV